MLNSMFDDLLLVMILAGIGVSVAYLRAELLLYRRFKAAERRREPLQRELHIKRVRPAQMDMPSRPRTHRSQIQTNVFPAMRVLARALRIIRQERNIHWFRFHTRSTRSGYGSGNVS